MVNGKAGHKLNLSVYSRQHSGFQKKTSIREKSHIFEDGKFADLVFEETEKYRGMIIELKCEDIHSNKGSSLGIAVKKDIEKIKYVKKEYRSYTYVVLAMAYTESAHNSVKSLGLHAIEDAEVELTDQSSSEEENGGKGKSPAKMQDIMTFRAYKKNIEHEQDPAVKDLTDKMGNAGL